MISAGKHRGYSQFAVFLTFFVLVTLFCSHSLSRGASLSVSLRFLLTGTLPKSCSSATSVLNDFFNISQNFVDHWMPLHRMTSVTSLEVKFLCSKITPKSAIIDTNVNKFQNQNLYTPKKKP